MRENGQFEISAEEPRMQAALQGYAESVRAAAERPEGFWAWQRGAIAGRLAGQTPRARRLSWAGAMVVVVLLAAMALQQAPADSARAYDPDEALLVDVGRSLRREVPAALAPAALLAAEMTRAAEAEGTTQASSGESR